MTASATTTSHFSGATRANLRFALRRLRRSPGFAAIAVLSLAIGIGANTAIFSLVNAILLRPTVVRDPSHLVSFYESDPDWEHGVFSIPNYRDVRDATGHLFDGIASSTIAMVQFSDGTQTRMLPGEAVSSNYFEVLGVGTAYGRPLSREDDITPGGHPVVVLSHDFFTRAFAGDPSAVGKTLRLGDREYEIVGVADPRYPGNLAVLSPAFFVPQAMLTALQGSDVDLLEQRGNHGTWVIGRRKPGVELVEVEAVLSTLAADLRRDYPEYWDEGKSLKLLPFGDVILLPAIDRYVKASAWLLSAVVGLVLLLACTNLASFLLAQGLARKKEIALRLALGASRRQLIGQLLVESLLLATMGGIAGIGLAVLALKTLTGANLPLPVPITLDLDMNLTVLGFTFLISLAAGFALGLLPALQSTNPAIAPTLKDEGSRQGSGGRIRLRGALVASQVAVSTLLVVGAGLFLHSLIASQSVDPGFGEQPAGILAFDMPATRYSPAEGRGFVEELERTVLARPEITAVGTISNLHLNGLSTNTSGFQVDGHQPPPGRNDQTADTATVNPGFFEAAGIRIIQGRNFGSGDTEDREPVVIVSRALAETFWPGEDPIGRVLRRPESDLRIIGVAADAKVRSLGEAPRSFIYFPLSQSYDSFIRMIARTEGSDLAAAEMLRVEALRADPDLWVWESKTMAHHLGTVLLPRRLSAGILAVFAALALALAAIGLYGIVGFAVVARTREIGIRMSLGANSAEVLRLLMGTGLRPVAIGAAVGLALSLLLSRLLSSLLFGVDPFDPLTFALASGVLLLTATLAAGLPALRALRISPMEALHYE